MDSRVHCINLEEQFGELYKTEYEEGHNGKERDHEFFQLIPCKYGSIQPWDEGHLSAYCNAKKLSNKWRKEIDAGLWTGFKVIAQGDYELRFYFPLEKVYEVAKILKARKKRQLSPEHKERLIQGGRDYRKKHLAIA